MEVHRVCIPVTENQFLWLLRICDPLAQGPIVSLIGLCSIWMIVLFAYYRLQLFVQRRQRDARQQEQLDDYRNQTRTERDSIEQILNSPAAEDNAGVKAQKFQDPVPVSIWIDDKCGVDLSVVGDVASLMDGTSLLRMPDEEVKFLKACADSVFQTKLTRQTWPHEPAQSVPEAATKKQGRRFIVQLGRWQLIYRPSTENTGWKAMQLSEDETNEVPVILHSSHSGGILTVEGLYLTQAAIQASTKDKCITLKTKSIAAGPGGLEVFTSASELPSKNLAEVFLLASKNITTNEDKFRVISSAIRIQNDNLRAVLRSILPFTALLLFATMQIVASVMRIMKNTSIAIVITWLLLFMIVISSEVLPRRIETAITRKLMRLAVSICHTFCFAAQCFIPDKSPEILSMNEVVSRCLVDKSTLNHGNSSASQSRRRTKPREVHTEAESDDDSERKSNSKDKPALNKEDRKASNNSLDNPDWEWPIFDTIYPKRSASRLEKREHKKIEEKKDETVPFEVVDRKKENLPWASQIKVNIYSAFLLDIIKKFLPNKIDQSAICKKVLSLNAPDIYHISDKLREEYTASEAEQDSLEVSTSTHGENLLHLKHLLRFMDKEFEQHKLLAAAMASSSQVSWEMLWAFFPPGKRVVYLDNVTEAQKLCGDVSSTCYEETMNGIFFSIQLTKWDYNCKTWKEYSTTIKIAKFEGERKILSLSIYPLKYTPNPKSVTDEFLKLGKKFCELSMLERSRFMDYKGSMSISRGGSLVKENADGRIMIDLGSFAKMNPNYELGSAQPPSQFMRDNIVKTLDITKLETRMFAPSMVYGFSFRLKKWGSFSICGISKISFNKLAFDDLVMDADTKESLENLVRQQLDDGRKVIKDTQERDSQVDPIASKGEGTIILCYGPPGTGKTLTAESLSERLTCPLWCLSVSELGTTPATLENTLVKVMDVAASWGALLLLDEADVFLEKRTTSDLTRNAMTGVFLRTLEYYRGVLFLTTNRDSAFDDAICSRIALFLHYDMLSEEQRKTIWTTMFERIGLQFTPDDLAEFATPEFNGREIRNIVKTAYTLSKSKDDEAELEIDNVRKALKVHVNSTKVWGRCKSQKLAQESVPDRCRKCMRTLSTGSL